MENGKVIELEKKMVVHLSDHIKYSASSYCANCMAHSQVEVPKGTLLQEWEDSHPCSKCGCTPSQFQQYQMRNRLSAA